MDDEVIGASAGYGSSGRCEAVPDSFLSRDHTILENGKTAGSINFQLISLKDEATITAGGEGFHAWHEGVVFGDFLLASGDGEIRARASRPNFFRDRLEIHSGGADLVLKKRLLSFRNRFDILMDGNIVGSISRRGLFSRRLRLEMECPISPEIRIFLIWLALVLIAAED